MKTRPRFAVRPSALLLAALFPLCAGAQIRTDGSVGKPAQTLAGPNFLIPESIGRLAGANLFHSFESFNIRSGESADFTTATPGITNVISRVSGGASSQINGGLKLTPASGSPDFFLINPAGVTFGAGASIDVPGAFHVSTADYVKFPDGNFHADTAKTSTFSSAPPEAFGFHAATRANVRINGGAELSTRPLKPITVIGGDVELDRGTVSTLNGGDIRVVAVGQKQQEVTLTGTLPAADGNLSMRNGSAIFSSTQEAVDAGSVTIRAGSIAIAGVSGYSGIASNANAGSGNAGSVDVAASGSLSLVDGAFIISNTRSSGSAGMVKVGADSVVLDGQGYDAFISSTAFAGSRGASGNVEVRAVKQLSIIDGGLVSSSIRSSGDAGSVKVSAGNIAIDRKGSDNDTGILSNAMVGSSGNAGAIDVSSRGQLSIVNGGEIVSRTLSSGDAGAVKVSADHVSIDGQGNRKFFTGILSQASSASTGGHAGSIDIVVAGSLSLVNEGVIQSSTFSSGNGGSIKVGAASISMDGHDRLIDTGIVSSAYGAGNAGSIEISVPGVLSMLRGGTISTSTYGRGNAGSIKVDAGSVAMDGQGGIAFTGIFSDAHSGVSGNAGTVDVSAAGNLSITNMGLYGGISSSTSGSGRAGSVKVGVATLLVDGNRSSISASAESDSSGQTGSVAVNATDSITLANGGKLSIENSATVARPAALTPTTLMVTAPNITLDGTLGGQITATTTGNVNAGNIVVTAPGNLSILSGGEISSDTALFSSGNAGSVKVNAGNISIDRRDVWFKTTGIFSDANTASTGNAGNVEVNATGILSILNGGQISSDSVNLSSGNAGSLKVSANNIIIDQKGSLLDTGIFSDAKVGSTGSAGSVDVLATGSLSILDGGRISSNTYSPGKAGSVKVSAGNIAIDRQGNRDTTGIFSDTRAWLGGEGNAGSVEVTATGNLHIVNGGSISSDTYSEGNAGSVKVNVGGVSIDRKGSDQFTGISSNTNPLSKGNAGNVEVSATGSLSIASGGAISSKTSQFAAGKAGSVKVSASALSVDGAASNGESSSINASADQFSSGQTGSVVIAATDSILLSNGGQFAIRNDATVTSPGSLTPTTLSVAAPRILVLDDAKITSASTGNVSASNIAVSFTDRLSLDSGAIVTSANLGNGGAIGISGGGLVDVRNSQITTSVAGLSGNGGDIRIGANALAMRTGFIQANTAAENASGGKVVIDVRELVPSGNSLFLGGQTPYDFRRGVYGLNVIQAAAPTGLSGTVSVTAPSLDISGTLTGLKAKAIDGGGLGRSPCQIAGGSSLVQAGRGGFAPSARELLGAAPMAAARTAGISPTFAPLARQLAGDCKDA